MDKQEEFFELVKTIQQGYSPHMRTVGNERLAFVVVMMAVTKQSLIQVLQFRADQFQKNKYNCIFSGVSPRVKRPYRIFFPVNFPEYLEGYCQRYQVEKHDLLFSLNIDYITRLLAQIIRKNGWSINLRDIRKLIPHAYKTTAYREMAGEYLKILRYSLSETWHICVTGDEICEKIQRFIDNYTKAVEIENCH